MASDLYPTYGRQYQRQDSNGHNHYQLQGSSTSASVMYPPTIVTQPATVSEEPSSPTQNDPEGSNSPSSPTASSPKQESPTGANKDGLPQQPTKPQATFLTKLYACVQILLCSSPQPLTSVAAVCSSVRRTIT
jgi:hypothetical protein